MEDREEDPEGFFYEKFFLIDQAVSAMDQIYATFLKLRISADWGARELPAILEWIRKGKRSGFRPLMYRWIQGL